MKTALSMVLLPITIIRADFNELAVIGNCGYNVFFSDLAPLIIHIGIFYI